MMETLINIVYNWMICCSFVLFSSISTFISIIFSNFVLDQEKKRVMIIEDAR